MDNAPKQKTLIVVAGPTAVGKTALAIELARYFETEIISADSRQFYREMSIGTAKPNTDELAAAKHHFVNSHSITDDFNVGDFEKQALKVLDNIFSGNDTAVLAGGSGLFIKAICEGFDDFPAVDESIRLQLNQTYADSGITFLQEHLKNIDPLYYEQADINNPQRLIRAIEVYEATGKAFSSYRTANIKKRPFNIVKIGLNLPRPQLYDRINQRVDLMMDQGLLNEVTSLLPYRSLNALNTVGYSELFAYLDGNNTLTEAIAQIKQNTRRFAKRQLTWFNKDKLFTWFEPTALAAILDFISLAKAQQVGNI